MQNDRMCHQDLQNIAELVTWDMTDVVTLNGTVDVDFSDCEYHQDWVDLMASVKRIKTYYHTTESDVTAEYRLRTNFNRGLYKNPRVKFFETY